MAPGVPLGRRSSTPHFAIVVKPRGEDLPIVVVHLTVRTDELLQRSADLVAQL